MLSAPSSVPLSPQPSRLRWTGHEAVLELAPLTRATTLAGPDLPVPADAQLYEITLEPEGGSPTGRPTGPIIAKGLAAAQNI